MKFDFWDRTRENVQKRGVIHARSREAAYEILKKNGIRPSRVEMSSGLLNVVIHCWNKANIFVVGFLLLIVGVLVFFDFGGNVILSQRSQSSLRRQLVGDLMIIEKGIRIGWTNVFSSAGDRFLASFAIPGVKPTIHSVSEKDLLDCLYSENKIQSGDSEEVCQLKSIVSGLKAEAREFLDDGGTLKRYGELLVDRQNQEIEYYERAKAEIEQLVQSDRPQKEIDVIWEQRNEELRRMGIRMVSMPETWGR